MATERVAPCGCCFSETWLPRQLCPAFDALRMGPVIYRHQHIAQAVTGKSWRHIQ